MNITQKFYKNYYGIRRAGWAGCFAILIYFSATAKPACAYVDFCDPSVGIELEIQSQIEAQIRDGEPGPQSDGTFLT